MDDCYVLQYVVIHPDSNLSQYVDGNPVIKEAVSAFFGIPADKLGEVTSTDAGWITHLLAHHPEWLELGLDSWLDNMQENLSNPDVIGWTKDHPTSLVFKRKGPGGYTYFTIIGKDGDRLRLITNYFNTPQEAQNGYSDMSVVYKNKRGVNSKVNTDFTTEPSVQDSFASAKVDNNPETAKGNGKNLSSEGENLTFGARESIRTKNFKRFFGDWENDPENASKVVDKNGEPLVVHHRSSAYGFTQFFTDAAWNKDNVGSHFGSEAVANDFQGDMYNVYLNIRKPWDTWDWYGCNPHHLSRRNHPASRLRHVELCVYAAQHKAYPNEMYSKS